MAATPCERETHSFASTTGPCTGSCDKKDEDLAFPLESICPVQVMQAQSPLDMSGWRHPGILLSQQAQAQARPAAT